MLNRSGGRRRIKVGDKNEPTPRRKIIVGFCPPSARESRGRGGMAMAQTTRGSTTGNTLLGGPGQSGKNRKPKLQGGREHKTEAGSTQSGGHMRGGDATGKELPKQPWFQWWRPRQNGESQLLQCHFQRSLKKKRSRGRRGGMLLVKGKTFSTGKRKGITGKVGWQFNVASCQEELGKTWQERSDSRSSSNEQ